MIEIKFPNVSTDQKDNFRAVWDALISYAGRPAHAGFEDGQSKTYVFRYTTRANNDTIASVYKLCRQAITGNFSVRRLDPLR